MNQRDRDARVRHDKWLAKQGLHPDQLKVKRNQPLRQHVKAIDRQAVVDSMRVPVTTSLAAPRGNMDYVPKRDTSYRKELEEGRHVIAPAYNKGPYMVIARADLPTVGKKV